jgi:hypothetical protein
VIASTAKARLSVADLTRLKEAVNKSENPVTYLGIDPGESNGICGYDSKFYLQFMTTIYFEDITKFLHQFDHIKLCVVEGYHVYPNKAQQHVYSNLKTPRVIGRIESWAEIKNINLIRQPATVKATGYKWIGEKPLPKSNPQNHALDAHVHFMYWAVRHGKVNAADLLRKHDV